MLPVMRNGRNSPTCDQSKQHKKSQPRDIKGVCDLLWRTRRQRQERDVFGSLEVFGAVPSGLIENENGMCAWGNFGCDFVEMELHGLGVASGEHESSAGSALGAYRSASASARVFSS